jgi:NADP-dependent 3-hydroxy acid dehydrogenase YdfG
MDSIRGKTVLLTGASTGFGPHIARRLHQAGAKFVLSARNRDALNRLAEELGDSRVIVADLARLGEAERLAPTGASKFSEEQGERQRNKR